jgi:hypothetical protein
MTGVRAVCVALITLLAGCDQIAKNKAASAELARRDAIRAMKHGTAWNNCSAAIKAASHYPNTLELMTLPFETHAYNETQGGLRVEIDVRDRSGTYHVRCFTDPAGNSAQIDVFAAPSG